MASFACSRTKMCLNIGKQSYSFSAPSSALVNGRISVHLSLIKGASGGKRLNQSMLVYSGLKACQRRTDF